MAKKKSKTENGLTESVAREIAVVEESTAERFVGQWNRLISTTNWEKGRIVCQWRNALVAAGAAVTDYSDEAWAQLVGGVTSQHVGRLRRVYQRFGETHQEYDGLFWSHFQSAIEWEDAEMWLEGAIRNDWSVSQMRGKRWETLGLPGAAPAEEDAADEAFDVEFAQEESESAESENAGAEPVPKTGKKTATQTADDDEESTDDEDASGAEAEEAESEKTNAKPAKSRSRLAVEVDELPSDLADAFEQFKLAIIAHRREGWKQTSADAVIECLDALRELTLAPSDD